MHIENFNKTDEEKTIYSGQFDLIQTKRIYKTLSNLSNDAVAFLNTGQLKEFSFSSDKMRPMMAYINDNKVKISKHLNDSKVNQVDCLKTDTELKDSIAQLRNNLKVIEAALTSMSQVQFNPAFFISEELTNAYLDYQIPLAWEFDYDLIVILNLNNRRLIDSLIERGQKRIFLISGNVNSQEILEECPGDVIVHKEDNYDRLDDLLNAFGGRPPRRVSTLDCGPESSSAEDIENIKNLIIQGRNNAWLRFNTINRADALRIMDNLHNMTVFPQASEFHGKFKGHAAVVVCPGPSLKKNVHHLRKLKGKALIICVLHALKAVRSAGVLPDIVIHTDPSNLKNLTFERDGKVITHWDEWIENNKLESLPLFVTSCSGSPEMFKVPSKNIAWMSPGLKVGEHIPLNIYDYSRVGGSVSHSAFDLAIELGCDSIALIGQDLAFSKLGDLYVKDAVLDSPETELAKGKLNNMGEQFEVKGFYGDRVKTNASFSFFAKSYTRFAEELKNKDIKLFNCTEGGAFIEGFEHLEFNKFVESYITSRTNANIDKAFQESGMLNKKSDQRMLKDVRSFITKNMQLSNELDRLINGAIKITKQKSKTNHDLSKFDNLQNKSIRKMKKNYFYTLGLQREMYMLTNGLKADRSLEGQLAFHSNFLDAASKYNRRFRKAFSEQLQFSQMH